VLADPEVRALRGSCRTSSARAALADHIGKLTYLDASVKETLRLSPVLSEVGRRLERPMRIGGRELPAGIAVGPCIYLVHRRPDLWPDPERFDPRASSAPARAPTNFSLRRRVRRCIGMAFALYEMKVVPAQVLLRLELRLAPGYRISFVRRSITLAPSAGDASDRAPRAA